MGFHFRMKEGIEDMPLNHEQCGHESQEIDKHKPVFHLPIVPCRSDLPNPPQVDELVVGPANYGGLERNSP
jgi:hypothetical protein